MKRILYSGVVVVLLSFNFLNAQIERAGDKKLKFITPYDLQRWTIIDDFNFDKIKNWTLTSSDTKKVEKLPVNVNIPVVYLKKISPGVKFSAVEGGRFLTEQYKNNPYCLGVKVVFPRMAATSVFLKPDKPYQLNGYCKKISLWLLGRGRDVDFELVIKDYLGRLYYLYVTKLNYLGWRYFEINIPAEVPQNFNEYPQRETISIEGFLITNHPKKYTGEVYKPFYLYIDELEVLLDRNYKIYPGLEIKDNW